MVRSLAVRVKKNLAAECSHLIRCESRTLALVDLPRHVPAADADADPDTIRTHR